MPNPLGAFRQRNLLTQEQAAKATGVSLSTWCQLERGYRGRRPSRSFLTLLDALDRLRRNRVPWPHEEPERLRLRDTPWLDMNEDDDGQDG
jgi:transcriptional regulator with XRE-family HTH domain